MSVVSEDKMLLTVTETGYGRRSSFDNYRVQSRGGKGLINYHTETYGDVAAVTEVDENEDIILIASDGIIIRIAADSVSTFARPSKGVRVMKVSEGERLVTLTTAEKDEEEEETPPQDSAESGEENKEESGDSNSPDSNEQEG